MYPEAVSPVPTDTGYNGQSLEIDSSLGEIPYDSNGTNDFINNGYSDANINGGSAAVSPTPCTPNEYNVNVYPGYSENESTFIPANGNGSTVSGGHENSGSVVDYAGNGYNANENGSSVNDYTGSGYNANENGSSVKDYADNGYNTNESSGAQFVRRRLLPAIPKGFPSSSSFPPLKKKNRTET